MPNQIPAHLRDLRVRLVAPEESPEHRARVHLKELLTAHGQHLSKKTLAHFSRTLNGLLLHGLRARAVSVDSESTSENEIRFRASDGQTYVAPRKVWNRVLKADPGAREVSLKSDQVSDEQSLIASERAWGATIG